MAATILIKRDTSTNWFNNNPILRSGEFGLETDTRKIKIGNGQRWNSINKFMQPSENNLEALLVNYILASEKGAINGIATLDSSGKILLSQLPDQLSLDTELSNALSALTTSSIPEGTNKYFTNQRAIDAVATNYDPAGSAATAKTQAQAYADDLAIDILNNIGDSLGEYIPLSQFGTPGGVATLSLSGVLNLSQIPDTLATKAYADGLATNYDPAGSAATAKTEAQAYADLVAASAAAAVVASAPSALNTLNELAAALANDSNYATTINNALSLKAPVNSPTFTGTVYGVTKSMVGLANVDNTSDANKPVSTDTQIALDTKINRIIETNPQPASYSIVASDAFKLIEMSGGGTLTIVDSLSFLVGTTIEVLQTTDSQVTIEGSGFTPNSTPGLKLRARWSSATLLKRGTNSWVVMGDLSA